jgi:hypothetical protein
MRHSLKNITLVLGAVAATTSSAALFAVGCGGDDSVANVAEDGSSDSTTDVVQGDAPLPDVTPPPADGGTDTGNGGEAAVSAMDAGDASDAAAVTDANSFSDIADVQFDVPPLTQFPAAVMNAFCSHLTQCCIMSQDITSASQWNQNGTNGCVPYYTAHSGAFGIADHAAALSSGHVGYDAAAASACLDEWSTLACGTVSAASLEKIKDDCFGATVGTLSIDAGPCLDSLECAFNEFCRIGDAGTGTCVALSGPGQPCTDIATSFDCDYLGLGTRSQYCAPGDGGATCQSTLPEDASCSTENACQSGICVSPRCVSAAVFSSTPICQFFALPDGGDGG